MTPENIEEVFRAVMEMQVTLSGEPQTEPPSYFHEKLGEIHRHESYLTDLIVKSNRWMSAIDNQVTMKKQEVELKFSEAITNGPDIRRKKSVGDRKAAAIVIVKAEKEELVELLSKQSEIKQLCRSLARKERELKAKSIDLKRQSKIMESEWGRASGYREGRGARTEYAPPLADQTPTAEDLGIESELSQRETPEETAPVAVEVGELLSAVVPVPADEVPETESVDEGAVSKEPAEETVPQEDLDALLASLGDEQDLDTLIAEDKEDQSLEGVVEPETPPAEDVGEVQDLDSVLADL